MKVTDIKEVLNLALSCRKNGYVYNPLFTGDAGIGKSEICQAWAKEQGKDFGFIDLRFAYLEGPDLVGNPFVVDGNTFFATPSFWPKEGKGLLLLEEVNRAHNSTLNCLMQLLTDRRVNGYKLPDGWIIAGVINPDNEQYAVNNLDTALMDRFEEYPVLYDKRTFMDFINQSDWDKRLIAFIDTVFTYKRPSEIGAEGKYVAPRTLSKVNATLKSGLTESNPLFFDVISANLGKALTAELVAFFTQNKPILLDDILADEEGTFKRIEKFCGEDYRGDMLHATTNSVVQGFPKKASLELCTRLMELLPPDMSYSMITSLMCKEPLINWENVIKGNAKLKKKLKSVQPEKKKDNK